MGKTFFGKKFLWLILICLLGAVFFQQYAEKPSKGEKLKKDYLIYQSKNPSLDFTFQYPSVGWTVDESEGVGQSYDAVQLLGPRDHQNQYSTSFAVTVKTNDSGVKAEDQLDAFLKTMERFRDFKILEKGKVGIQNNNYPIATYGYVARLPLWKKNAKDVLMREEVVFLSHQKKSYRITYLGTAEQNRASKSVFEHLLKTFKFLD